MVNVKDKEINAICRQIREEDLEMIMKWRMMPEITRYMNSDPKLTLEGQKEWYKKIQASQKDLYWILEVDGVPAGVVSLVDNDGHKVHTGVYIAEKEKRSLKLTMYLQWNLYRYSFEKLGVNKVCEEVFEGNKGVNRILDMCGSKREGVLRNHVYKNGTYYDVVMRGVLAQEWKEIQERYTFDLITFQSKDGKECY